MDHDIALRSAENERKIVGRLLFSLEFQHIQTTTVNLESIKFEFAGKHEHCYYFSLQAQTPKSTIDCDVKPRNMRPIYESSVNRTFLQICGATSSSVKLPSISFQTTLSQLNASCLKVSLWIEPEIPLPTHAPKSLNEDEEEEKRQTSNQETTANDPVLQKGISLADRYESDVLVGDIYISFPKLLGEEMKIFDHRDASLIHRPIVRTKRYFCRHKAMLNRRWPHIDELGMIQSC